MPTYQTTPYISWTFPDQAVAMNRKGVRPLEATHLPQQDMIVGPSSPWDKATREMVLQGLHTNRVKEEGMLFNRNTTDRTQAFDRPAHLSQTRVNGRFEAPSYEYSQTAGGLRGGTGLLTPEGRAWGKKQLMNRVAQLNAIDSGDYSQGKPQRVDLDPKLDNLDVVFVRLLDSFGSGLLTQQTADLGEKLVFELASVGSSISANKLASYAETVSNLQVQTERYFQGAIPRRPSDKEKAVIRTLRRSFNRFQQLAEEIARVVYEPEDVRRRVMGEILSRLPRAVGVRGVYSPDITPGKTPERPFISESPYARVDE